MKSLCATIHIVIEQYVYVMQFMSASLYWAFYRKPLEVKGIGSTALTSLVKDNLPGPVRTTVNKTSTGKCVIGM